MSYILDALKKAESERHLGSVPHLHAQPAPAAATASRSSAWRNVLLILLVLSFAGLLLGYWLLAPQKEAVYMQTVTTAVAPSTLPPGFSTPAVMSSPPAPPARKPAPEKIPAQAEHSAVKIAAAPPPLDALPEALRKDLPALSINGYLYADKPADRSVLINNKLLREGEAITPELLLEKIDSQGLVLNFRGTSFRRAF